MHLSHYIIPSEDSFAAPLIRVRPGLGLSEKTAIGFSHPRFNGCAPQFDPTIASMV
jgi:hypothetical protein